MKRIIVFFLILILGGGIATACNQAVENNSATAADSKLSVSEIWARPGQAGGTSAIYFVINNQGAEADKAQDVKSDAAMMAQLHQTEMDASGAMKMVHQADGVAVPAGDTVTFKPGGLHVMLMNLKQDLKAGDTIRFTLVFEKAGSITLEAPVKEP